jgi:Bacterial Ig-like domain (group 3)
VAETRGFIADALLVNGSASYTLANTLIPIPHTVVATYNGDKTYAPKSFAIRHAIQPPTYATQTRLAAGPSPVLASRTVRMTATVTGAVPVPAGVVTFLDGGNSLGPATLDSGGVAYHDTALLGPGTHSLSVQFQGYTKYGFDIITPYAVAIFSPSTSPPVVVTVTANVTSTTLSASSTSPIVGTVVTFTANVASAAGAPFGGATLYDGSSVLGTAALKADGSATFSTASLGAGVHSITAAFNPNGPFAGSTSPAVSVSVLAASATAISTAVSLAPETSLVDGSSTLVANVGASQGSPGGRVTFIDNGVILGVAETDQSGTATLRVAALKSGLHDLNASFAGAPDFAPSVSPEIHDQWPETGPGFTLALGAGPLRVTSAGSNALDLGVVPLQVFQQQVHWSCASGLPDGYRCSFSPGALSGGGRSTLTILPVAKAAVIVGPRVPLYGLILGLLSFFLLGSLSRHSPGLLLLLAGATLGVLGGCGTSSSVPTAEQRLVLTVRATAGAGPDTIVHSAQVSLILSASR